MKVDMDTVDMATNRAQFLYNAIYLSHENLIKLIFVKNALNVFGYIYFLQ